MRVFALLLVLSSTALSQVPSIPFSLNGGSMQVQGTFTAGPGGVCCSGVVTMQGAGNVETFCCYAYHLTGGCYGWGFIVEFEGNFYAFCLKVDPALPLGQQLGGFWYETGVRGPNTTLLP